jgi:hypothetical protein
MTYPSSGGKLHEVGRDLLEFQLARDNADEELFGIKGSPSG